MPDSKDVLETDPLKEEKATHVAEALKIFNEGAKKTKMSDLNTNSPEFKRDVLYSMGINHHRLTRKVSSDIQAEEEGDKRVRTMEIEGGQLKISLVRGRDDDDIEIEFTRKIPSGIVIERKLTLTAGSYESRIGTGPRGNQRFEEHFISRQPGQDRISGSTPEAVLNDEHLINAYLLSK